MPKPLEINNFRDLLHLYNQNYPTIKLPDKLVARITDDRAQLSMLIRFIATGEEKWQDFISKNNISLYGDASMALMQEFNDNRRVVERFNEIDKNLKSSKNSADRDQYDQLYSRYLIRGISSSFIKDLEALEIKTKPVAQAGTTKDMMQGIRVDIQIPQVQPVMPQQAAKAPPPISKEAKESHFTFEHKAQAREREIYYVSREYFGRQEDGSYVAKVSSSNREIKKDYLYSSDQVTNFINQRIVMTGPAPALGAERLTRRMR